MLTPVEPLSLRDLFLKAAELADDQERQAYLMRACGNDAALRRKVEQLLQAHSEHATSLLDIAVSESQRWPPRQGQTVSGSRTSNGRQSSTSEAESHQRVEARGSESDSAPISRVGPYQIIEQIGQGGMGAVYLAEQTQPVRRQVALKIIKPGMDSQDVIARFEAERQALALMEHPHIARVLDAGKSPTGRPYFVMELVRGVPITQYCRDAQLPLRDRLELFIKVCQGVRHAHQKGIIHRDLKPSNILVTLHDGAAVPKVIDFGVAKALDQRLTERTIHTRFQQMIGTPAYMSPEQAEMGSRDVDTRTDVYSLGVLLYELVTGTTPFDNTSLTSQSFDEMRRIIREEQPQPPSRRCVKQTDQPTISQKQPSSQVPRLLRRSLQRELDWIVLKALEKDRARRYEFVGALAQDVQRFLDDEPVEACPPSMGYRLRKLARRNKGWITAAALIAAVLVIATIISTNLAIRAIDAEHLAEQATEDLRERLYASDVVLAAQDWRNNDIQQARSRLARHIPQEEQRDLRGFEWHYLWNQQQISGVVLADTGDAVYDIEISPEGDRIAAVGADAMIRIFDLASHHLQLTIPTQQGETNGVTFSPDGRRLAAAGDDGTVRIWDLATQRQLVNVHAHEGLAFQVVFSPDGETLASCGEDNSVRLWRVSDGSPLGTLNVHAEDMEAIAISPAGIIAAGGRFSQVSLWNLLTRQPLWETSDPVGAPVSGLTFSDRGCLAYGTIAGQLTIAEINDRAVSYRRRFANGIQSLDFAPGGQWLIVGDRAGHLQIVPFENGVWNLASTRQWSGHDGRVYRVTVTPDGQRVLSGGADGRIVSWDLFADAPQRHVYVDKECNNLVTIDESRFAIGTTNGVYLCDAAGRIVRDFGDAIGDCRVQYARQASLLFATSVREIVAWDTTRGSEVFRWGCDADHTIYGIAVDPRGHTLVARVDDQSGDREIRLVDVPTRSVVARVPARSAQSFDVSTNGRWLVCDSNNDIQLVDLESRAVVNRWPAHDGAIRRLRFFADSMSVAGVSDDRTIKVWTVPDGELVSSTMAHRTSATRLALMNDGRRIATGGADRMLRFWDGDSLQLVWEHPLQLGQIRDLVFSSDDQKLFCLCSLHDVLILDGSPAASNPHQN